MNSVMPPPPLNPPLASQEIVLLNATDMALPDWLDISRRQRVDSILTAAAEVDRKTFKYDTFFILIPKLLKQLTGTLTCGLSFRETHVVI